MVSQVLDIETLSAAAFGGNFHLIGMYLGTVPLLMYLISIRRMRPGSIPQPPNSNPCSSTSYQPMMAEPGKKPTDIAQALPKPQGA